MKLSVQLTPTSWLSFPSISPSFVMDFEGFFELGSEGDVIHLLGLSWPWVKRNSLPGK